MAHPKKHEEGFYEELEDFAQALKAQKETHERRPAARIGNGCLVVLSFLFFLLVFFGAPVLVYHRGLELYHFHTCRHTTTGQVIQADGIGSTLRYTRRYLLTISYTPSGGSAQLFTQRSAIIKLTTPGTTLPVRYKEGHAFIDDGQHNINSNLLLIGGVSIFWYWAARILHVTLLWFLREGLPRSLARLRRHRLPTP